MDADWFTHPREAASTALALLTASAHGDDESRFELVVEMTHAQTAAALLAMCGLVVGGWPVDLPMPLPRWLAELGRRVPHMSEELPPST